MSIPKVGGSRGQTPSPKKPSKKASSKNYNFSAKKIKKDDLPKTITKRLAMFIKNPLARMIPHKFVKVKK